jgi:hypothetical protein
MMRWGYILCEGGCDEYRCKAADSTDEGCIAFMPIFAADVFVGCISTTVHSNTKDDEDLVSELARRANIL